MARMHDIFRALQSLTDATVDRAMAAALPTADRQSCRLIGLVLLQRQHPQGLLGLILHYHRLPRDTQQTVCEHVGELFSPLREAAKLSQTAGPTNVVHIIRQSANTRLAYLVAGQLRRGDGPLRAEAAQCLADLADRCVTSSDPGIMPALDPQSACYLQSAIEEAIDCFSLHNESATLLAALRLMPRPCTNLLKTLSRDDHPAGEMLGRLVAKAENPDAQRITPLMLSLPRRNQDALRGLTRCIQSNHLDDVLKCHHLLRLPAAKRTLSRWEAAGDLLNQHPVKELAASMPDERQSAVVVWLDLLPLPGQEKVTALLSLKDAADPAARLLVLRRLIKHARSQQKNPAIDQAIVEYCDDPQLPIARLALRQLVRSRYPDLPRLLAKLVNSPHPELRRCASDQLGPIGFARLWEAWHRLDPQRRIGAGRALIKIDPNFHRLLGEKLRMAERQPRLRALAMITELNQAAFFDKALQQLAHDADERVASAAVKALGGIDSPQAMQTIDSAIEHPDSRVRANAIEALAQNPAPQHVDKLLAIAAHDEHRPRASAIGALVQMRVSDALPALAQMLTDERPQHRTSALWLVQQTGMLDVAQQVADMSLADPDPAIRNRARNVIQELLQRMNDTSEATPSDADETKTTPPASALVPLPLLSGLLATDAGLTFEEINRHWNSTAIIPVEWFFVGAGALILLLGLLSLRRWWKQRDERPSPTRVLLRASWAAGLDVRQLWLLTRIARQQKLPSAVTLMLSPRTLRYHAREYALTCLPWRRARIMARVAQIRRQIFGDSPSTSQ